MAADFLSFMIDKYDWDNQRAVEISDSAARKEWSVFHYLYNHSDLRFYEMDEEQLIADLIEFVSTEGRAVVRLSDSAGMRFMGQIYERWGSASETVIEYLIPLYDTVNSQIVILTKCPDSFDFVSRIENILSGSNWTLAVCDSNLWSVLRQMFVDPMITQRLSDKIKKLEDAVTRVGTGNDDTENSDVRQLLNRILNAGHERDVSDVHFIPNSKDVDVRIRVDGVYTPYTRITLNALARICKVVSIDSKRPDTNINTVGKGKFQFTASDGMKIDMRYSILPTRFGRDLNIRFLNNKILTLEETGLSSENIQLVNRILEQKAGMLYVTGPVGSGKTSTIYAAIKILADAYKNIITAEDPVEYTVEGITQVEVEDGTPLTFETVLETVLRHDPDVVLVGELRTPEAAKQAMKIANTGRLVMCSLHTNDSIGVFERLKSLDVDAYTVGEVSAAILTQRLVRRLCPHCRKPMFVEPNSAEAKTFNLNVSKPVKFYAPGGCRHCFNTGYKGRVAITEIMIINSNLRAHIQNGSKRSVFEKALSESKFKTMIHDGIEKAMLGMTSLEELKPYANDIVSYRGNAFDDNTLEVFAKGVALYGKN